MNIIILYQISGVDVQQILTLQTLQKMREDDAYIYSQRIALSTNINNKIIITHSIKVRLIYYFVVINLIKLLKKNSKI